MSVLGTTEAGTHVIDFLGEIRVVEAMGARRMTGQHEMIAIRIEGKPESFWTPVAAIRFIPTVAGASS